MPVIFTPPGVFIKEIPGGIPTITGVATSITAFVGPAPTGPAAPTDCFDCADFARQFGELSRDHPLGVAVFNFFLNGGDHAIIVRVLPGTAGKLTVDDYVGDAARLNRTGLYALDAVDLFNLLCISWDQPDADVPIEVYQKAAAYCVTRRAMLILDSPSRWSEDAKAGRFDQIQPAYFGIDKIDAARNCAVYFPRVMLQVSGRVGVFPACGSVAGVMAATDEQRGVWMAPAGLAGPLFSIVGLEVDLTDEQNGMLNPLGINCLREFPSAGTVIWGARTLAGAVLLADDYKYIPVRRLALYIEESLYRGTKFAAFEPNAEPLWSRLRLAAGAFLTGLARQGAFLSSQVLCDGTTTTQADIDRGVVNIIVMFAPVDPAEFVVIKIAQSAGRPSP